MAIFSEKNSISDLAAAQAPFHLIFTSTWARSPLRARKTIELCGAAPRSAAQPQCVFRSKLNLRLRNLLPSSKTAAEATTTNDTICCQSMLAT
jgi:hypothetical protein